MDLFSYPSMSAHSEDPSEYLPLNPNQSSILLEPRDISSPLAPVSAADTSINYAPQSSGAYNVKSSKAILNNNTLMNGPTTTVVYDHSPAMASPAYDTTQHSVSTVRYSPYLACVLGI